MDLTMIAPVSLNKVSFTSDTPLFDEHTYEKVRSFLVRSKIDHARFTLNGASEQCGVPPYLFLRIVNSSKSINDMWKNIQCDISEFSRVTDSPTISQEVFNMLQDAQKTGKTNGLLAGIASHMHLSVPTIRYIIDSDINMSQMYKSILVNSRSKYSEKEIETQCRIIEKILLESIKEKLSVSFIKISDISGLSQSVVKKRILDNQYLNNLYIKMNAISSEHQVKTSHVIENIQSPIVRDLISLLQNSDIKPTMNELSRNSNYSLTEIKKAILSSKLLQSLWFIEPNLNTKTDEEKAEMKKLIIHAIEDLKQSNERITHSTIAIQTGIKESIVRTLISKDSEISTIYLQARQD